MHPFAFTDSQCFISRYPRNIIPSENSIHEKMWKIKSMVRILSMGKMWKIKINGGILSMENVKNKNQWGDTIHGKYGKYNQ